MSNIPLLLAWRYIRGSYAHLSIATMSFICFLGIIIATFALTLVLCIMSGFEKETHKKLRSMHAQIIIRAHGKEINAAQLTNVITKEFPQIQSISPVATGQVMLQSPQTNDLSSIVMIKGIDPHAFNEDLQSKLIASATKTRNLAKLLEQNGILIGKAIAQNLHILPDDEINLAFAKDPSKARKKITLSQQQAKVTGIFKTGIEEFDEGIIYCSLDFFKELFPAIGVTQINIELKENANEKEMITQLKQRTNLQVYSWQELYPALVAALKLEKYAMFFILALIMLVASMNIISVLFMQITNKKADIAILRAMGCPISSIQRIFYLFGFILTISGSLIGLLLAFISGLLLQTYPFIQLPDTYYVSHLPVAMSMEIFVLVFVVTLLLATCAVWLPTRSIKKMNVATILRFEG